MAFDVFFNHAFLQRPQSPAHSDFPSVGDASSFMPPKPPSPVQMTLDETRKLASKDHY